jgi:hypothetical protein
MIYEKKNQGIHRFLNPILCSNPVMTSCVAEYLSAGQVIDLPNSPPVSFSEGM